MTPAPGSQQQELYRPAFVHNCLALLVRARHGLADIPLRDEEEPSITGLLVKKAKEITESEDAELWMEHLEVLDDPPQNDQSERQGKRRPRIDIEFVETRRGVRPRLHVEAKRMYRSDSVKEYLGAGGLVMFLRGGYASEWPSAAMLGYVQNQNCEEWRKKIALAMAGMRTEIATCGDRGDLTPTNWSTTGLEDVQESCHNRVPEALGRISIYHILMDCC